MYKITSLYLLICVISVQRNNASFYDNKSNTSDEGSQISNKTKLTT